MNDLEKLEAITAMFTHGLINYKFDDAEYYLHLIKRVRALVDCELVWQASYDKMMGGYINDQKGRTTGKEREVLDGIEKATRDAERGNSESDL